MLGEVREIIRKYDSKRTFERRVIKHFGDQTFDYHLIMDAYNFSAKQFARKKRDDGTLFFKHKVAVAVIVMEYLGIHDAVLVAAALLHDLIEDFRDIKKRNIKLRFGSKVAHRVCCVSKPPKRSFHSDEAYDQAIFRKIVSGGLDCEILKCADRLHNLLTLWGDNRKKLRKIKQTVRYVFPIAERINVLWQELLLATAEQQLQIYVSQQKE
jgi:(p)ppGpp synthase/HD superfamily hydrolase